MEEKDFENQYVGFEITCKKCGSKKVYIDNSLGYSSTSGAWGSVDLICSDCGYSTEIVEA